MHREESVAAYYIRQNDRVLRNLFAGVFLLVMILVSTVYLALSGRSFGGGKINSSGTRTLYLATNGKIACQVTKTINSTTINSTAMESVKPQQTQDDDVDEQLLQLVTAKCTSRDLVLPGKSRQFAHLHHMKTGGTSFNQVLRCALARARTVRDNTIPFYSLSECGYSHFQRCLAGEDPSCTEQTNNSIVMEFCAPLFAVNHFDWLDADLFTILRDPVDRVWSMYRFETKSCYKCLPLKEIYEHIDNNTTDVICKDCKSVCMMQLGNHLTRNMLTNDLANHALSEEEMLAEAKGNLLKHIAFVGMTEEIVNSTKMIGKVFPWLNETIEGSDVKCSLPHANSSPSHNGCGDKGGHLALPDHPDDETRAIILKHNKLDQELYEEAKRMFALQKKVLEFD